MIKSLRIISNGLKLNNKNNLRLISTSTIRPATITSIELEQNQPQQQQSPLIEQHDIVIVGGGLAGLALASALSASESISSSHKITLLEASSLDKIANWSLPPDQYSNRVSSITADNVDFFDRIGVWQHVEQFRTRGIEEMQVWDGISNARIGFTSPLTEEDSDSMDSSVIPMATLVENLNLQRGLIRSLNENSSSENGGVEIIDQTKVASVTEGEGGWPIVHLGSKDGSVGRSLRARLLIGADGFNSPVKTYSGIETFGWAYNAHGVVGSVQVESSFMSDGMNTAWQRFLPQGPIAFLPMSDNTASLVWSTSPAIAAAVKTLPIQLLPALINAVFALPYPLLEPLFKKMTSTPSLPPTEIAQHLLDLNLSHESAYDVDKIPDPLPPLIISVQPNSIASFPLKMSHADTYLGLPKNGKDLRTVLVGDAAHTIHPMAGQGLNMGIADVRALVDTLEQTMKDGGDLGAYNTLRSYPRSRYVANHAVISATDHLNTLYSSQLAPIVWARSTGLEVLNELDFLKNLIMKSAGSKKNDGKNVSVWSTVADGIDGVGKVVGLMKTVGTMAGLGLAQAFAARGGRN